MPSRIRFPLFSALVALSACSFANDTLWPSLSGEDPRGIPSATNTAGAASGTSGTGSATSASTIPGAAPPASGVGRKTAELREQLQRLDDEVTQQTRQLDEIRGRLDEAAGGVDTRVAGIETRLKSRGTPNDPQLLADWNDAQGQLNRTSEEMARARSPLAASSLPQRIAGSRRWPRQLAPDGRPLPSPRRAKGGPAGHHPADRPLSPFASIARTSPTRKRFTAP